MYCFVTVLYNELVIESTIVSNILKRESRRGRVKSALCKSTEVRIRARVFSRHIIR